MKLAPSRKHDSGGSHCDDDAADRLKRIKHEPLSPPPQPQPAAYHSEDEQSNSLSDESDDEDEELSRIATKTGDTIMFRNESERVSREGYARMKLEIPNDETTTTTDDSSESSSDEDGQSKVGKRRARSRGHHVARIDSPVALPLTSLTPPLEITQAIDEEDEISSISPAAFTDDGSTDGHLHQHPHYCNLQPNPTRRRSSVSRNRSDEVKLSEEQSEHLSRIIDAIKEGNFDDFTKLVGKKKDCIKILLNAFVDGQTALHYSLLYGRSPAWCKLLVLNGANPNQTNRAGWHPIHLAAYNGCPESMLYLIDRFAEW